MLSRPSFNVRRHARAGLAAMALVALAACDREPGTAPSSDLILQAPVDAAKAPPTPPNVWKIPLSDAALGVRSDGRYSDGTYSLYTDGICTVEATIFYGSPPASGDATMKSTAPQGGKCGRTLTLHYPDGFSETLKSFNNLNQLETTEFSIPVGATMPRRLIIAPGSLSNNPSRCGRLLFGPNGSVSPGSDSVLVTRVDARTWHVQSQAAPNDRAYCETDGLLYEMPVDIVIVSGVPLP